MAMTLPQILRQRARRDPDRRLYTFLHAGEVEADQLTYAGLDRRAGSIAAALRRTCAPGDRALLLFPPGLDFIAAFFGCLYAGVVAVPAYPPRPRRDHQRLETMVRDCQPRAVLAPGTLSASAAPLAAEVPGLAALSWIAADGPVADGEADAGLPRVEPGWPAFLQYTSGSTAAPKGVVVSHANLMHNERMIQAAFRQDEDSVVVGWLPLYHDMGLIGNLLQPLFCGGRCILMSPVAFLQRPRRWLEAIDRFRATTSGGPNFAYELCVRKVGPEERQGLDLASWRVAYNGAEPVRAETLERFAEAFAPCGFRREAFHPCYGLAEGTLFVAGPRSAGGARVGSFEAASLARDRAVPTADGPPRGRRLVGCGEAWGGQRLAIVDPRTGAELPAGRVGEIWLSGPSVAGGYWGREEETARTFGALLSGADGSAAGPFLRTGDLGFVADGEVFVAGRLKDLVILRGRNHYPQDLEMAAERSHPGLRPGSVAAFSVEGAEGELLVVVAEVERRHEAAIEPVAAAVRRAVAAEHEVPVQEVVLIRTGTLPKTSSGKIQRHLCRARYLAGELEVVAASALAGPAGQAGAEPPAPAPSRDSLLALPEARRRAALLAALRELAARGLRLGAAETDPGQPLTAMGLDSLGAGELTAAIESAWGIAVSPADLLAGGSLRDLADRVLEAISGAPRPAHESPGADEREALPAGLQGLWFLHRLAPGSAAYTIAAAARILGAADPEALRRAFQRLVDRHPALRTTFTAASEGLVARVQEAVEVAFVHEDATGWSAERLRGRLHDEAYRPFDLERGPVLRVGLFTGGPGEEAGWLVLAVHHIAADFGSLAVAARELAAFYAETSTRAWLEPVAPGPRYIDYVRWQEGEAAGPGGERLWRYWLERLAGAPRLELPTDRPRPPVEDQAGAAKLRRWGPERVAAVRELGRRRGATPFMVLMAAFQALLARYSGQTDFLVGAPTSGRAGMAGRFADLVGYCVNPVALRADLAGDLDVGEWLDRVRRTALAAFAHRGLPFAQLVERLQPEREPGRPPLFDTMLSLEQAPGSGLEALAAFPLQLGGVRLALGGLELESVALAAPAAPYDLTLFAAELGGGLAAALHYKTGLFERATAERMLRHFGHLLSALAGEPERRVWDVDLLAPEERRQLLAGCNQTRTDYPREATVHRLFERWAREEPDRIALVDPQRGLALSYGGLNRRADRLARELRACGAGAETLVGVALERSAAMVEATLAVLKAGAAYVPLDPAAPRRRLESLVREVSLPLLLTESRWLPGLPAAPRALCLDRLGEAAAGGVAPAGAPAEPRSLAYVMFTSGSTGAPKAVGVAHRAVVRLVRGTGYIDFGRDQVFLQLAPAAFDAATLEIWGPLANGGRLALFPPRTPSFAELETILAEQGVSTLWLTAGLFHQVVEQRLAALRPVRQLLAGGDVLSVRHVNRLLAELPGCRLFNGYGPTESTTFTCVHAVSGPVPAGASVPIGKPIANTRVYVLDERFAPVPVGVAGELCIGGDGLARGYLRRPELTAERFVPSPFRPQPELDGEPAEPPGARLYRTGDRVRRLADGTVEFLGRMDRQVKIRGFRVEPAEIEAVLAAHPEVREAAVLVETDRTAGDAAARRLVAVVVAAPGAAPLAAEIRDFLRQRLPEPMIPAACLFLDVLPLTANGKVDRRALAALASAPRQEGLAGYAAPRTPAEELLAGIWADLLRVERVGIHDDFFALGGHSLLASRLPARLRAPFGLEPPLAVLFENPTLAGFASALERLRGGGPALADRPLLPAARDGDLPLSFAQERLWFLDRFSPGSAVYNVPAALRLRGVLQVPALAAALAEIRRRHEALRTVCAEREGSAVQRIEPPAPLPLPCIDLGGLADPSSVAGSLAEREARRPFDLRRGPLLRAALLRLAADDHLLVLSFHHIVFDGWSVEVFLHELGVLYGAFAAGAPSPLEELAVQYADYAVWQRAVLAEGALAAQLAHWRGRLAGAPPGVALPTDRPRPAVQTFGGVEEPVVLSAALTARLRRLARQHGSTLFAALLAGFSTLLSRYSGQVDLVVGTAVANRSRGELEPLIGLLINTLPLRVDLASGEPTAAVLLGRLRELTLDAFANREVPFERLVEELQPHRDLSRSPLFNTLLVLRESAAAPGGMSPRLPGLAAGVVPLHSGTAKFELTLALAEAEGGLAGGIELNTALFDRVTVRRMRRHLEALLAAMATDGQAPVAELPWLDEAERRQMLVEWNATAAPYPRESGLHELFAARAARDPEAVALIHGGLHVSYGELARRAGRLAGRLRRLGVGPEVLVAVLSGRTPEMVAALFAVLAAGGAYVPFDPGYPRERLALLLADCGAPVLLTEERLAGELPPYDGEVVLLDALGEGGGDGDAERFAWSPVHPEQLAYVIYTSGSTGRPKGVAIRHGGAAARIGWALSAYPADSLRGVLAATSICFDLSVFEIFVPLAGGGAVVLAGDALALPSLPAAGRVTLVNTVPSAMAELARTGALPPAVSVVNLAGEALRRELVAQIYSLPGVEAVYNLYGPSEDTTYSSGARAPRGAAGEPTIGRPLANSRAHVLDERLRPVPIGVPGVLWLGGEGLARGYLNRPALTAERFRPDPFADLTAAPGRLYETGDLARWRRDGELEFLGRADQQVKVRGFRIELGEIEAALAAQPGIVDAAVVADGIDADRRLVGYVQLAPGVPFSPAALRARLRRSLPEPMVPSLWISVPGLPRTPNGKVDRRALPAPGAPRAREAAYAAPRTPLEELLAGMWADLLGAERVGVRDNFFSLGGHSLLAARLAARILQSVGVETPLRDLFEHPTIEELAPVLERAVAARSGSPALVLGPVRRRARRDLGQLVSELSRLSPEETRRRLAERDRLEGRF